MASKEASPLGIDLESIFRAMKETGATELDLTTGDNTHIFVRRSSHASRPGEPPSEKNIPNYEDEARYLQLKAPFAGVLYLGPEPGKEPHYVTTGDFLEKGQIVAMIEAMKLMSEITVPRSGKLVEIFCQDGALVNKDDVLMVLDFTQIPDQRS